MSEEPQDQQDEVEGHMKRFGANDEPAEDTEGDEVEAHGLRYDKPSYDKPSYD